jgi:hypothetical protein
MNSVGYGGILNIEKNIYFLNTQHYTGAAIPPLPPYSHDKVKRSCNTNVASRICISKE